MEIEDQNPFPEELEVLLNNQIFKRSLVLWLYYRKRESQTRIHEITDIPTSTISDIIKKWKTEGSVENQKGQGRKPKLSEFQEKNDN